MKKIIILIFVFVFMGCSRRILQPLIQTPLFECYFDSVEELTDNFKIVDKEFYNENPVLFRADMVELRPEGLVIKCIKEAGEITTWQKSGNYNWICGCLTTWDKDSTWNRFYQPYGIWEVEAVFPRTWAALWLLHPDYFVPEIGKTHIIPEVDFAENNGRGGIENVVHYGWHPDKYATNERLRQMHPYDGKVHKYAVRVLPDGYMFYLDGILVNSFRSKEPSFSSDQPKYLIMNNAVKAPYMEESEFLIKSVKFYPDKK